LKGGDGKKRISTLRMIRKGGGKEKTLVRRLEHACYNKKQFEKKGGDLPSNRKARNI